MGIFSFFSKSSPSDYETVLAKLATDINEAKVHLSETRLRERRLILLVNAYGVAVWAVWAGLWWLKGLPWGLIGWSAEDVEPRAIGAAGVMGGPFFIYGLNWALHFFFARIRNSEETHLRALLSEQRKQLDAIKKATNYDSTRKLIEQYDQPGGSQQPGRAPPQPQTPQRKQPDTPSPSPRGTETPRAPGHLIGAGGTPMQGCQFASRLPSECPAEDEAPGTPVPIPQGMSPDQALALQMQLQAIQPVLPTPEKKWYDRVVDSILGEDPSHASQSKYALVCGECFRHNGLVGSKYEWERMQWICPRCNHLNPPPLSRLTKSDSAHAHFPSATLPAAPATPTAVSASPQPLKRSSASPRPRRQPGDKGTPRSSRLGKEVFSASDDDGEEDGMEIDEK